MGNIMDNFTHQFDNDLLPDGLFLGDFATVVGCKNTTRGPMVAYKFLCAIILLC